MSIRTKVAIGLITLATIVGFIGCRPTPINIATPSITPSGGTFTGSVSISLACTTPLTKIYYTTDGSLPSTVSSNYNKAFTLTSSATVKAMASLSILSNSAVANADFTIVNPLPPPPPPPTNQTVWRMTFMYPATNAIWTWCPQPRSPYHHAYSTFNFGTHGWGDGENTYRISCAKQAYAYKCNGIFNWAKMSGDTYNNFDLTTNGELPMFIWGCPSPYDGHYLSNSEISFPYMVAAYGLDRMMVDMLDSPPEIPWNQLEARIRQTCARTAHLTSKQCILSLGLEVTKNGWSREQFQQAIDWAVQYSKLGFTTTTGVKVPSASPEGKRVVIGMSYGPHKGLLGLKNVEYWMECAGVVWNTGDGSVDDIYNQCVQFQKDVAPAPAWFGELTMQPNSKIWADLTDKLLKLNPAGIATGNFSGGFVP